MGYFKLSTQRRAQLYVQGIHKYIFESIVGSMVLGGITRSSFYKLWQCMLWQSDYLEESNQQSLDSAKDFASKQLWWRLTEKGILTLPSKIFIHMHMCNCTCICIHTHKLACVHAYIPQTIIYMQRTVTHSCNHGALGNWRYWWIAILKLTQATR